MTLFSIFAYTVICVCLGFMIGRDKGAEQAYIDASSEHYKAKR